MRWNSLANGMTNQVDAMGRARNNVEGPTESTNSHTISLLKWHTFCFTQRLIDSSQSHSGIVHRMMNEVVPAGDYFIPGISCPHHSLPLSLLFCYFILNFITAFFLYPIWIIYSFWSLQSYSWNAWYTWYAAAGISSLSLCHFFILTSLLIILS